MLIKIPDVLTSEGVKGFRQVLNEVDWIDGRVTAGHQSARSKHNLQVAENNPASMEMGAAIVSALEDTPLFMSAALPLKIFPPLFNRYESGQAFGNHIDNAVRQVTGTSHRVRTDLSATLFLSSPEEYDGGELVVEDTYGAHSIKLPAGHLILYPASSLHHVRPVARGVRLAAFFWVQSMVRDDGERTILFDLDAAIQGLNRDAPDHPSAVQLTGVYHNLLRRWSEV